MSKVIVSFFKTKALYTILLLFLAGYLYGHFSWYGLPEQNTAGRYDTVGISWLLFSLLLFASLVKSRIIHLPVLAGMVFLTCMVVFNWWHVEFYQDYIVPSSLKLGMDASEGLGSLPGLSHVTEGLMFMVVIPLLTFLGLLFRPKNSKVQRRVVVGFACVAFAAGMVNQLNYAKAAAPFPIAGAHPVGFFVRELLTGGNFIIEPAHAQSLAKLYGERRRALEQAYPLYRARHANHDLRIPQVKNVILIMLESVRASESGVYAEDRQQVTPNLMKIAQESLTVSQFYTSSTQTVRSEMAAMCSVLDFNRGAPFSSYGRDLNAFCLPHVLKQVGYDSYWFHGNTDKFFDRDKFFPTIGVDYVYGKELIETELEDFYTIGWGISDVDVFSYALEKLESADKPFFAEIMTLSNHHPFDWDWKVESPNVPSDNKLYSNYLNGIHYTDHALGEFWKAFKQSDLYDNTAVFITGDHGIWLFDKPSNGKADEWVRAEQYYRLPLVVYYPGVSAGEKLERVASHVDIAPTILDMLGIDANVAFLGESIFSPDHPNFALIRKFGGYGYVETGRVCFPVDYECDGPYQACKTGFEAPTKCAQWSASLIEGDVDNIVPVNVELADVEKTFELMERSLVSGFIPEGETLKVTVQESQSEASVSVKH